MKLPSENTNITLDDLLGLVETAIHSIERLQTENAFLVRQLHESEDAISKATARADRMAAQIQELEDAQSTLKTEAEWRGWFRNKYGNSTFFTYIEKEYLNDHPDEARLQASDGHAEVQSEAKELHEQVHPEPVQELAQSA